MNRRSITADSIRRAELDLILGRVPGSPREDPDVWGLALSGGGIRSATFALGVLQVLARRGLLGGFHYLSTISGGGYIGAFVQGLIRRRGYDGACDVLRSSTADGAAATRASPVDPAADVHRPILHLREYSNYLSPRKSAISGDTLGMLGTYVRNVLLVQFQIIALLLVLSLVPLLSYPLLIDHSMTQPGALLAAAAFTGAIAALLLAFILSRAMSGRASAGASAVAGANEEGDDCRDSRAGAVDRRDVPSRLAAFVSVAIIGVLFVAATCAATALWGLNAKVIGEMGIADTAEIAGRIAASLDRFLFQVTALVYFASWMAWLAFSVIAGNRTVHDGSDARPPLVRHGLRFTLATIGASALAGLAVIATRHVFLYWQGVIGFWHVLILGPSCVLAAVTLTGIVHIGLAGPALSDLQREIWARVGGRAAAFFALGVGLLFGVSIYGPLLLRYGLRVAGLWSAATGWAGIAGWIVTTGAGLIAAYGQRTNGHAKSRVIGALVRIAPWVFLLGLVVGISFAGQELLVAIGWDPFRPWQTLKPEEIAPSYLGELANGTRSHFAPLVFAAAGALVLWAIFGGAVDPNEFSMNAFYRNRIVRCYLGASNANRRPEPTTNFDPKDDLGLSDVIAEPHEGSRRPLFPLIGTTLNLVATRQLDWQDRKAASFCMTPGFCGFVPPPSHPDMCPVSDPSPAIAATATARVDAKPVAASLSLGDAVAISGAAVSPNMGYHSSPAVMLLLTLFDARLGWWLPNPNRARARGSNAPRFPGWWLIAEMLGLTREGGRQIYLSDGGHFDNLGIYELVRRRSRFILCVDSSADPDRDFADLGSTIQKCRVDFGIDIEIDTTDLGRDANGASKRGCAMGTIRYPDGESGWLLYLKPSIVGSEPADVAHYARAHPSFPHEPTSDQYFDEAQFESYRRLGEHVASLALESALERAQATAASEPIGLEDSPLKQKILVELEHGWVSPLADVGRRFSRHADAMSALFAKLRETPALEVLDAQIYPSWIDLVAPSTEPESVTPATPLERRTCLPAPEHFRSCFYFCQELIQLMESVYHDMDLEHAWQHPDNRGWMNIFRHWSGSPIFRIAWAVGAPTYGRAFVTFCELRLDLPRLDGMVVLREESPDGCDWREHCDRLARDGRVNHIELEILKSDAILACADPSRLRLKLLRMRWLPTRRPADGDIRESTVGVAVLEGDTLRLLRVEDHLRRMGLGDEFMRRLIADCEVRSVDIRPGRYGSVAAVTAGDARRAQQRIDTLLRRQHRFREAS